MVIRISLVRRVGAPLLFAESAAFGAMSIWFCYELVTARPKHLLAALFELVLFLLFGAVLFLAGKNLSTDPRTARTPALLINLIALPISYYLIQAGRWPVALPIAIVALLVVVSLIAAER